MSLPGVTVNEILEVWPTSDEGITILFVSAKVEIAPKAVV
jgi:DNA-directed RNA polymerase subunit F